MPTYFARGVSVRLGAMPLSDTTTQKIILKKGDAAKQQSELAEKRLLKSKLLREERVPFPGDEAAFQLNWLAKAPFMQTRVGSDVYEEEDSGNAKGMATDAASLRRPKALALHVNLSDKTYVSGLYNQKASLKIDVFFNGILSACWSMPSYDVRSGMKGHHQVFAGTRVDFLAERPWVVLPPGVAADGSAIKNNSPLSAEQRWQQLSRALQAEARERGTNEEGNIPPTAEFLRALATIQMPEQVHGMQKPGGKTFGVIDVVVTSGEGRKLTSGVGYLKAPKRMIDESYPFVLGADDSTMHLRADAPSRSESDAEVPDAIEPSSEVIDVDAEEESDREEYGSHTKRQTLQSRVQSKRDVPPVSPSALQHPIMEPLIPSIPSPVKVGLKAPALVATNTAVWELGSSAVQRNAAFSNIWSSPEIGRAKVYRQEAGVTSRAEFTPRMIYPDLPPNLQTPQMHPSLYTFQFSDPTLGGVAPSDLMRQIPFNNAGLASSPLGHCSVPSRGPGYEHSSSYPTQMPGVVHAPSSFSPYAYFPPGHARVSLTDTRHPRQNRNMSGMGPPLSGTPESYQPSMLPQAPALHGRRESWPPQTSFSAFDRRLSMPLPPAALYSVPTKPKRSISPKKVSPLRKPAKTDSSIVVRRLVIYGQRRSILVDHRWEPAKHFDLASNSPVRFQNRKGVAPAGHEEIGSIEPEDTITDPCRSKQSAVRIGTPPPTSPPEHRKTGLPLNIDEQQRISACQTNILNDQPASTAKIPSPTHEPGQSGKVKLHGDQSRVGSGGQSMHVTKQRPSRRTASSNNILGVQGPKANPFWFEDPEEILREASARLRRSRSFAKQGNTPDAAPSPKSSVPAVQDPKTWETASSSPLSSLHTTPEPDMDPIRYARSPQVPHASSPAPIPQADGSPEHKLLPRFRRGNRTPSPVKLASTLTTPQLPCHDLSTPQSSATKKRKNLHRSLPKEPRSPTRLKTNDNPLLNRDCVIAYAESKDKKNKQGILRQVKSERLGVFSENDVVFAARFFVEE